MRNLLCSILAVCVVVPNAFALDLSLNQAVEKIVNESNDIKKADANIKKAKAQLNAVNANRWMSIDGTASYMNLVNIKKPGSSQGIEIPSDIGAIWVMFYRLLKFQIISFLLVFK